MTIATHGVAATFRRQWVQSTAAVVVGFGSVAALSLATDQLLHVLHVYPPWGEPMYDARLLLLALFHRTVYTIVGGYLTARLARVRRCVT